MHTSTSTTSGTRRPASRRKLTKAVSAGAIALAALAPAAIAEAACRPKVDYSGTGTFELTELGTFARGAGRVTGTPFDGTVTFMLRADDGSLPAPGECESGGANLAVTGRHRQALSATSIGEICGQYVQEPTSVVTHVFTGQYSIYQSTKRLRDTEGWIEIRLATGDRMSITLFDS
jgi:hypothetical protein